MTTTQSDGRDPVTRGPKSRSSNSPAPTKLNPTGMYSRVVLVTPEMAAEFRSRAPNNRKIRKPRVQRYCRRRRAGEWHLHHQGMAFDTEGTFIDGNHRCEMVIETGLPTAFWVTYNVPKKAAIEVDGQLIRSPRDAIAMAGQGDYSSEAVSAAMVIEFLPAATRPGGDLARASMGRERVLELLKSHAEAIAFAEPVGGRGFTRAVRALLARAWYRVDLGRLEQFRSVLIDGVCVSDNPSDDRAAVTYRDFLRDNPGSNSDAAEAARYRKGQTAVAAFLERQPIRRLAATDKDLFPLPESRRVVREGVVG